MVAILAIEPKYAGLILVGVKKYEFRKRIFKKDVNTVLLYVTSPIKGIIGEIKIGEIVEDSALSLWKKFGKFSGMDEKEFFEYLGNKGYAIEIKEVIIYYPRAVTLEEIGLKGKAIQSWIYCGDEVYSRINELVLKKEVRRWEEGKMLVYIW